MKLYHLLFILTLISVTACTERIDLNLDNDTNQRLVVDAWLTDEVKAHEVKLSLTSDYFKNEPPEPATGATVRISDGSEIFELQEAAPGHYLTDNTVQGIPGHTYTLTIDWEGKTYSSTSLLTAVPPIDSLDYEEAEFQDEDNDFTEYSVLLYTTEPPTEDDAYFWKGYLLDAPNDLTRTYWEIAEDKFVNGSHINGAEVLIVEANPGDRFIFEQYNISPAAFDFFVAVQSETIYKGGIFDTPPANVPSNIDNGALGFFVTGGVVRSELVIE